MFFFADSPFSLMKNGWSSWHSARISGVLSIRCGANLSLNMSFEPESELITSICKTDHSCCSYLVDKEKVKGEIIFFVSIHVHKCTLHKGKKNIENWVCFLESRYDIICLC
jgi:hypothetical protein